MHWLQLVKRVARDLDKSIPPMIRAHLLLSLKVVFKINPPVFVCLDSLVDVTNRWQLNWNSLPLTLKSTAQPSELMDIAVAYYSILISKYFNT